MTFKILDNFAKLRSNTKVMAYLIWDNWNDYSYHTLFSLVYVDENFTTHSIGSVKIGFFGQKERERKLSIGDSFDNLEDNFFSLGQSDDYYAKLKDLGTHIRESILTGLNDIAKDSILYERAIEENVTKISLFRNVSPTSVTGQYRRIAQGGARLTNYNFRYIAPRISSHSSIMRLSFDVQPESFPPTNVHVLIGRNGVGKTHLLNNMIEASRSENTSEENGEFISEPPQNSNKLFANLISVSFSAFDESRPREEEIDKTQSIQYSYIGLKYIRDGKILESKSTTMLTEEFFESLASCKRNSKVERWKRSIEMLESDPNFEEANIKSLINTKVGDSTSIFNRLSSGHKIVLLTITRLIETLQERSLVLLDEPESHLHPPLLSAFIRTLSDLLITTNGVAIIATHSPVILQEVPKICVWKLRRTGAEAIAERLNIESFGENLGVLTSEVFGLEVTKSGFYRLIMEVAQKKDSYEEVISYFNGQLGMEARAIIMSVYANQSNQ